MASVRVIADGEESVSDWRNSSVYCFATTNFVYFVAINIGFLQQLTTLFTYTYIQVY